MHRQQSGTLIEAARPRTVHRHPLDWHTLTLTCAPRQRSGVSAICAARRDSSIVCDRVGVCSIAQATPGRARQLCGQTGIATAVPGRSSPSAHENFVLSAGC